MKPIFSRNEDIDKITFLNWRISKGDHILNLVNIADGFLLSAIELTKHAIENNQDKRADILIFPIFTNANHGIELYLKALNWMLNKLTNSGRQIEGKHNLKQIFQTLKCKFKEYGGSISFQHFKEATVELESYINELFDKIQATPQNDKMDFSRYSLDNDYVDHFYVLEFGTVDIDLENLLSRFEVIKHQLDHLSEYLYYFELNQET
jgi:hypothetical protein